MKDINIKTIRHEEQVYPTVGNYWESPTAVEIRVSLTSDWRYEALVTVHELIEKILTTHRNISDDRITEFDLWFEKYREPDNHSEPGDHVAAPYRKEHFFATSIERLLAAELGVDWDKYETELHLL